VKGGHQQGIGGAHRPDGRYECRPSATPHTFHPTLLNSTGPQSLHRHPAAKTLSDVSHPFFADIAVS
jgi:hypothetical protein